MKTWLRNKTSLRLPTVLIALHPVISTFIIHALRLVICNHGPTMGIAGTLTFGPAKSPTLRGLLVGKTTVVFPCSLLSFHFTALFAYIKEYLGISHALPWQNFGQSPTHFHAYPLPSPGSGVGWLRMTQAQQILVLKFLSACSILTWLLVFIPRICCLIT